MLRLPEALEEEITEIVKGTREWSTRQSFIEQAIREKLERWRRDHPLGTPRKS